MKSQVAEEDNKDLDYDKEDEQICRELEGKRSSTAKINANIKA